MIVDQNKGDLKLGLETFPLGPSIANLAEFFGVHDTGLIPNYRSGIIYHRKGFGSEQIVYQYEPSVRPVGYKLREGDTEMEIYELAFPYWIAVISYEGGSFQGIRHFYSPTPIYSMDQGLFVPSLPNTNTRGYSETSVGWVCLYHNTPPKMNTLQDRVAYALSRHDPLGEPYNYGNMKETDGYTTYKKYRSDPDYCWNPMAWAGKTAEEGYEWTLQEGTWMPLMVADNDEYAESAVYDDSELDGVEYHDYTLRHALFDHHYVYYSKEGAVELNRYSKAVENNDVEMIADITGNLLRKSIVSGSTEVSASAEMPLLAPKVKLKYELDKMFTPELINSVMKFLATWGCRFCGETQEGSLDQIRQPNCLWYKKAGIVHFDDHDKSSTFKQQLIDFFNSRLAVSAMYSLDCMDYDGMGDSYVYNRNGLLGSGSYKWACHNCLSRYSSSAGPFGNVVSTELLPVELDPTGSNPTYRRLNVDNIQEGTHPIVPVMFGVSFRKIRQISFPKTMSISEASYYFYGNYRSSRLLEYVDIGMNYKDDINYCADCDSGFHNSWSKRDYLVFDPGEKLLYEQNDIPFGISNEIREDLVKAAIGCVQCCSSSYSFELGVFLGGSKKPNSMISRSGKLGTLRVTTTGLLNDVYSNVDKYKITEYGHKMLSIGMKSMGPYTESSQYITHALLNP